MFAAAADLLRLAKAGYVLAREGVFAVVAPPDLPPGPRAALAALRVLERRGHPDHGRLAAAFAQLGPSYIKLGQFLATRRDVVGPDIAADLELLQDRLPPFPIEEARRTIRESFDKPAAELFESFSEPVAAASIAQVHRASTHGDGPARDVAVKVLRPDVERRFAHDLSSYYRAARLIERFHPPARRLRPVAVVDTLARTITLEMDLRLEAAAISEMAENTKDDPGFRVPRIDWSRTSRRVLTTEWIDGIALSNHQALRASGIDLKELAARLIQTFLRHAMRDGFFHADMHQGNLFVDREGQLVAVDFGITGRLSIRERRFLAEMLYGFIRRDYRRVAEVHFEAEYVPPEQSVEDFAQALRAIGEPLRDKRARDIAMSRVLTQLFEVTELFNMRTRPELILLQKTMVVVEGVARSLDPDLDMWTAAEPVVGEWIERNLGPAGMLQNAAENVSTLARFAAELPQRLDLIERAAVNLSGAAGAGLPLSPDSIAAIAAAERAGRRGERIALWIAALALAVIAVQTFL